MNPFELSVSGEFQNYSVKQNKEVEVVFNFETENVEKVLALLHYVGSYGALKVSKNRMKRDIGNYKVYQARIFETGESSVIFRSDLEQVKAENISFLSPQKTKVKLDFSIKS